MPTCLPIRSVNPVRVQTAVWPLMVLGFYAVCFVVMAMTAIGDMLAVAAP